MSQVAARLVEKTFELTAEDDTTPAVVIIDLVNGGTYSLQIIATDADSNVTVYASNNRGVDWTLIATEAMDEGDTIWLEDDVFYTTLKLEVVSQVSSPSTVTSATLVLGAAE